MLDMKEVAEETGSTSTSARNVVEKGEVEETKEKGDEKEKEKEMEEEKDKKNDKSEKEDGDKDAGSEQEIVFIQDMGFNVKIVSPGAEPFDIQVSSMELVQVIEEEELSPRNDSFEYYYPIKENVNLTIIYL